MPDVPNLPGVPALATYAAAGTVDTLLNSDAVGILGLLGVPQWGVYQNGSPVIVADTVMDLGYTKEYALSDYPIEQGSFASYDKIEQPFETRVRFTTGGSTLARIAFIDSIEAIIGDLNFYDVVTPDKTYSSASFVREEYRRNGPSLLTIDVVLREVRVKAASSSTAASASGTDQSNTGTVQPQDATDAQNASAGVPLPPERPADIGINSNATPVTTPAGSYAAGSA